MRRAGGDTPLGAGRLRWPILVLTAFAAVMLGSVAGATTTTSAPSAHWYDGSDNALDDASVPVSPVDSPLAARARLTRPVSPDSGAGWALATLADSRFATNSLPVHAPGSLSAAEARSFYWQGENAIAGLGDDLAARGVGLEARAREMFETRNALRSHVRDLMADQNAANYLRRTSPNLTWDEMVARKAGQGLSGDDIYGAIINTSSTSNAGVDAAFGGRR